VIEAEPGPVDDDLVRAGVLGKAGCGGTEERAWLDCDLASLAENWLGDRLDPRDLDAAHRADWLARVVEERPMPLRRRSEYERCYWILEDGQRAGTMALSSDAFTGRNLHLASLYVLPPYRGRGVGRRAMERLMAAMREHGVSLRLDTSWCWQRTVGFYLQLGLWVRMWKRELCLCWEPTTPPPRIEIGEKTASLSVPLDGAHVVLAQAHRRGGALELKEPARALAKEKSLGGAYWHAESTLALALARHGWPLVRSNAQWERLRHADAGAPEALAYKITLWEAWARKRGWNVTTPRLPGLAYPTWDELEAQWDAAMSELGKADRA
jgi:GNAT superfamily N-acetyltransferase